ncbi:MAG TPA: phenylalanine--tRNA ligase subunit beta, partial [Candidatus Fraserbacteria bacterium]|nr:phenylalanine--tRNA ligase subunit beta [Candidatus Fraserbacteria bacterium]
ASEVVLCSEKELGLSEDHSGILLLDPEAPVGTPLSELLGDTVLELELTPNLSRCLSLIGVAREVAALQGTRLEVSEPSYRAEGEPIAGRVGVQIAAEELCARYSALLIENIQDGPSPAWMQRRLRLAGMRPISAIVDITNYVMLEWGQPLHAFDYDRLRERAGGKAPKITVRRARSAESITTLDGVRRDLDQEMLIIADERGPIAIAGVMGGQETEVSEQTRTVLLESANFNNINNRRTVARLKLPSEAALRFTRGIPAELTERAARRAAELMSHYAQGRVSNGMVDVYPHRQPRRQIELAPRQVERLLGLSLDAERIGEVLGALDFDCEPQGESLRVTVPWHRLDVEIPADLIEEIARMIGYQHLPASLISEPPPSWRPEGALDLELEEQVRDILVSCGLTEVINYSLSNPEVEARLYPEGQAPDEGQYIRLANPLSSERGFLRRNLLAQLLQTVAANRRHRSRVLLFEIGRVYLPDQQAPDSLPDEPRRLALALSGARRAPSWNQKSEELDFFDLKGIITELLSRLGLEDTSFVPLSAWPFHPRRGAELRSGQQPVGRLGELHPEVAQRFGLKERTLLGELDLEALLAQSRRQPRGYRPSPRFPAIEQDLAIVLPEKIPAAQVSELIRQAGGPLLAEVHLFDVYQGEQVPEGQRSLAYSLRYRAPDRTLTDAEVQKIHARIGQALTRELGAVVRGSEEVAS